MEGIIYSIQNLINGKTYVGQTKGDINKRFNQHLKTNSCCAIHRALVKYGKEWFDLKVIDTTISIEDANEKEMYWIKTLNTLSPNGYNLTKGGNKSHMLIEFEKETYSINYLTKKFNITTKIFYNRIKDGWDIKKALTIPRNNILPEIETKNFNIWKEEFKDKYNDNTLNSISKLPIIKKICLISIFKYFKMNNVYPTSKQVTDTFNILSDNSGFNQLSHKTMSNYIKELSKYNLIQCIGGKGLGRKKGRLPITYKLNIDLITFEKEVYDKLLVIKNNIDKNESVKMIPRIEKPSIEMKRVKTEKLSERIERIKIEKLSERIERVKTEKNLLTFKEKKSVDNIIIEFVNKLPYVRRMCLASIFKYIKQTQELPTSEQVTVMYNKIIENSGLTQISNKTMLNYLTELTTYGLIERVGRKGKTPFTYKISIDLDIFENEFYSKWIMHKEPNYFN